LVYFSLQKFFTLAASPFSVPRFRWLFALCWLVWSGVHAWLLHWYGFSFREALADSVIYNGILLLACWIISSSFRYYLPSRDRYVYLIAITTVAALAWLFISRFFIIWLPQSYSGIDAFWSQSAPVRMAIGFLMLGTNTLINVLWYTLQEQQEDEKRKTEAAALTREAELYKLKEQLHPHFLFNSLNSINALIAIQPLQARNMIQQLADFLRGTLKKANNDWIPLVDEIAHLQLYLDIEKVRFGHRLQTSVTMDEKAAACNIPAMLLQPAVENAIKFGLYDTTAAITISIEAVLENSQLQVTITNPYDMETSARQKGTGFGLRSIERRLFLLFPQSNLLQTNAADGQFTTTIFIPQLA
jgi:hypothetical protein